MGVKFKIRKCFCPVCGRPASVYHGKHNAYLRCTFADCKANAGCSIETFRRLIEKEEEEEANK